MEEGEVSDVVGSSVANSPNFKTFRWLPDFSWVNFDKVNVEEKSDREPLTENTELVVNDVIQNADLEAGHSPVFPPQPFVISRVVTVDVNSENSLELFKHRNGESRIFNDIDKAGSDANYDSNYSTQNDNYNNGNGFHEKTSIQDIQDGYNDSSSVTSDILISGTDLLHCSHFEAADAKGLSCSNDLSLDVGIMEEVIYTKSMELLDCTGSTQDERSDWQMTVSNKQTDDISDVKIGAGLFVTSSNVEIAGQSFARPINCETDIGPTPFVSHAETFKGPVTMATDDVGLAVVLDDTVSIAGPAAMIDEAEPIIVSDDDDSIEIATTMADDDGPIERPVVMMNDDAVLGDSEYVQGPDPIATLAEGPAIVIVGSDGDDDELASKLRDAECDVGLSIQPVVAELPEKDCQHVSELSCSILQKTADDKKTGTGHCGLQNETAALQFAEMEISTELEASCLGNLETQQTESSINHNHRKEIEKILKTERLLFTVQQSLENDFQECVPPLDDVKRRGSISFNDSLFDVLNDVQKLLQELHASQSLETRSIARKMELLGDYKEDRSLLLYEGKLLKIRRRKLIGLSENQQQLYEKALSSQTQLETESENRIACDYSSSTANKPHEQVLIDVESIVEKNFCLKESSLKKMLNENSCSKKTVRFTLPDSVGTTSQAGKFNIKDRDAYQQQSQKITLGCRLVHHNDKENRLVSGECLTQASGIPISDSITEPQIQVGSSYTNVNRKATGNYCLKRSNSLVPVVTACKVSKASGSENNATEANVYSSAFVNKVSDNLQTTTISPVISISASALTTKKDDNASLDKVSLVSAGDLNAGGADKVLNFMPFSNGIISVVNRCTATSAVKPLPDSNATCSRKPPLLGFRLPMPITAASLKTSTAKFTSEPSGICPRKLNVPQHILPVNVATALSNRQPVAPRLYVLPSRPTLVPCLLSTHTVTTPSELHSPVTSSIISSCPSSLITSWNYQQTNCRAISQSMEVENIEQSLFHPLSAASVINSNIKQKLQQVPVMSVPTPVEKVLENGNLGSQIFNMKDLHETGCTSVEALSQSGCQTASQIRNICSRFSLKRLIDDNVIQPGVNVLSARCKNGQVFASVTPNGNIKNDRGQTFRSIRAWYLDAVELDAAPQDTIHRQVLYYGVPIKTIISGSTGLEYSSQDSPSDECMPTSSSERLQATAQQDEDLLSKTISNIAFLHLHSEAELEPCDKWFWSNDFTICPPSWLEAIDDWK